MVWAAIAVACGIIVLLGYFIQLDQIPEAGIARTFFNLRLLLLRWALILAAVALFVGLFNLTFVHWARISEQEPGWPYSVLLLSAFLVSLMLGLFFRPDSGIMLWLFNYVQAPVEAALVGLLAVTLTAAGFRLVARKRDLISVIFILTALLVLLGTGPWLISGEGAISQLFSGIRNTLAQVAAVGGARGILLGVALGAIVTGIRILLAIDRPYGD
jgi:hypothetical protein